MTHAYNPIYLDRASRMLGNMLHDAVLESGYDGNDFLRLFIQSGIAEEIENGNPKYVAGRSGAELAADVITAATDQQVCPVLIETYERSDVYWVGWVLSRYQWYASRTFRDILSAVSYDELLGLYPALHEADIQKTYEILDAHLLHQESKLKRIRKSCGLTQQNLADCSGISLSTIRAYERKAKDINKAQADILLALAAALKCNMADLLD